MFSHFVPFLAFSMLPYAFTIECHNVIPFIFLFLFVTVYSNTPLYFVAFSDLLYRVAFTIQPYLFSASTHEPFYYMPLFISLYSVPLLSGYLIKLTGLVAGTLYIPPSLTIDIIMKLNQPRRLPPTTVTIILTSITATHAFGHHTSCFFSQPLKLPLPLPLLP